MNVEIKCKGETLCKENNKTLEVCESMYIVKNIKMLLLALFGENNYTNYIYIFPNYCYVSLPPEFHLEIPNYYWG
jgi:hypothetical protein